MSTEIAFDDPCVIFALGRESSAFRREFRPQQRFPGAPCRAMFCGPAWLTILVLETGVGADRTQEALDWLATKPLLGNVPYRPKLVISAGFSGALQEFHPIGDVILATEIIDSTGNLQATTWPGELPSGEWRPPLHRARILCMPELIGEAKQKRELGQKFAAAAVDMESATVAHWCQSKGVPFGCVRSISDTADTGLSPQLVKVLAGGRVSPFRLAATVLYSPGIIGDLWRLAKDTGTAAKKLSEALGELLTLTLPGEGINE